LDLITSYNDIVLPTAWDIKDKSPFIDIDSSGLKVNYMGNMKMRNLAETYLICCHSSKSSSPFRVWDILL
ncbi:hypothetical protein C2G38_2090104, partial [Gigaspora rosea]